MKNLLSVFIKIFSFGIVCSFLLLSCQIGLGASVDTEAPTVEITYPPSNVAVRGEFTLAGNCADDKEVSGIEVSVESTVERYNKSAVPKHPII
ncbi:MAG: Ig-like domain-containing protein [Treponema sp.]